MYRLAFHVHQASTATPYTALLDYTSAVRPNFEDRSNPRVRVLHLICAHGPTVEVVERMLRQATKFQDLHVPHAYVLQVMQELVFHFEQPSEPPELISKKEWDYYRTKGFTQWDQMDPKEVLLDMEDLVTQLMRFTENLVYRMVELILYFFNVLELTKEVSPQVQESLLQGLSDIRVPSRAIPHRSLGLLWEHGHKISYAILYNLISIVAYELNEAPRILGIVALDPPNAFGVSYGKFLRDQWRNPVDYLALLATAIASERDRTLRQCQVIAACLWGLSSAEFHGLRRRCTPAASCSAGCMMEVCLAEISPFTRLSQMLYVFSQHDCDTPIYRMLFIKDGSRNYSLYCHQV